MPKVSIILTSYNHADYLREAIDSVISQTFGDYELIIWDDASSDDSWEIISSYKDSRIRIFRNEKQMRGIYGINKAITEVAQGEYIAIHHSDDIWEVEKLYKQVAYLDSHPETGAVFTLVRLINEDGEPFKDENHGYYNIFDQPNRNRHDWLRFFFTQGNALCHPSILVRKSCYADCGSYRYGFGQVPDIDMWIRLCMKYEIHILQDSLIRFRIRNNEANTSGDRPESRARGYYESYCVLLNYLDISTFDELRKIFPEADKYRRDEGENLIFIISMIALELKPFSYSELFGLNHLFELMQNSKDALLIKQIYDFDYMDFIRLTGEHDPFNISAIRKRDSHIDELTKAFKDQEITVQNLSRSITEYTTEIKNLNGALVERDKEISLLNQAMAARDDEIFNLTQTVISHENTMKAIFSSSSWRLTRPLRAAKTFLTNKSYCKTR